jgi:hypothetical protein
MTKKNDDLQRFGEDESVGGNQWSLTVRGLLSHALEVVYGSAIHDHTPLLYLSACLFWKQNPLSIRVPSLQKFERLTTSPVWHEPSVGRV